MKYLKKIIIWCIKLMSKEELKLLPIIDLFIIIILIVQLLFLSLVMYNLVVHP